MSKSYFLEISVNASLNESCMQTLLEKGKQLGFVYLNRHDYCDYLPDIKEYLTTDQAIQNILMSHKIKPIDDEFPEGLAVSYQDIYFVLLIRPEHEGFKIILMPMINDWVKTYENEKYFDFGRYTKLLIDFCIDFPIIGINTRIDW